MAARKQFATSIDTEIADDFRKACDEYGVKMNVVLETFMKQFARKEFELQLNKGNFQIEEN